MEALDVLNYRRVKPYRYLTPPYVTAEPVVTHHKLDLTRDLFMVVACDGLWDCVSSEEAVDMVGGFMERQGMIAAPAYSKKSENEINSEISDWVYEDANAATHLIRNAFGGSVENVGKLLAIPSPYSRKYRDDITATVLFFAGAKIETEKFEKNTENTIEEVDLKKAELKRDRLKDWLRELQKKVSAK
ncbi:hypothetical protein HK096_003647, partial [Nowakowskiella sp. JEL0078]